MTLMDQQILSVTGNPVTGFLLALIYLIVLPGCGKLVLKYLFPEGKDRFLFALTTGLGTAGFWLILLPAAYAGIFFFILAAIGIVPGSALFFRIFREYPKKTLLPVAIILVFYSGILMMLPGEWDECVYQLTVPLRWLRCGRPCVFPDLPYSGFPSLPQFLFLPLIALSGVSAAKSFAFLLFSACLLSLGKHMKTPPLLSGFIVAALLLSSVMQMILTGTYAEAFILPGFLAILFYREKKVSFSSFLLAGIFAGVCAAVKLTGCFAGAAVFLLLSFRHREEKKKWLFFLAFCAGAFLMTFPFYLRPFLETGNPFFPYFSWLSGASPELCESSLFHHSLGKSAFGTESLTGFFCGLFILGLPPFKTVFDGSFGYIFLLLIPFACVIFRRRKEYFFLFLFLYGSWYFSSPQARFFLPGVFLLVRCASEGIVPGLRAYGKKLLLLLLIVCAAGGIFSISRVHTKNFAANFQKIVLRLQNRITPSDLLCTFAGDASAYLLYEVLQNPGKRVLLLFEERTLYLPDSCVIASPLFQSRYFMPPEKMTPDHVMKEMGKADFLYVRIPDNNPDFNPESIQKILPLLQSVTALEDQNLLIRKNLAGKAILYRKNEKNHK